MPCQINLQLDLYFPNPILAQCLCTPSRSPGLLPLLLYHCFMSELGFLLALLHFQFSVLELRRSDHWNQSALLDSWIPLLSRAMSHEKWLMVARPNGRHLRVPNGSLISRSANLNIYFYYLEFFFFFNAGAGKSKRNHWIQANLHSCLCKSVLS